MPIDKELFRTLIKEGQEEIESMELYERPFEFEKNGRYVLVGVRQAGKSYMLCQRAKEYLSDGIKLRQIVYVNFDDERLIGMKAADLDLILQAHYSLCEEEPILLFDEIQNIDGWENFARRMANRKAKIFITGSNSKMLSRDIQSTLGGRFCEAFIFPYSFTEFIGAQGVSIDRNEAYGKQRVEIERLAKLYFSWGGFPELLMFANKRKWLNDLYEKIVLGDIILRNGIKNELALRLTLKRIGENVGQPVSLNRLSNLLKSTGLSASVSTVGEYVRYATAACTLFPLENFASKFTEKETVKKYYFIDNGLLAILINRGENILFENICAIHLYRLYGKGLYFYNRNIEVDFYVPDEGYAVQAAYSLGSPDTLERETKALIKLHGLYNLRRMVIVTYDEESVIDVTPTVSIHVIPLWKWLLNSQPTTHEG